MSCDRFCHTRLGCLGRKESDHLEEQCLGGHCGGSALIQRRKIDPKVMNKKKLLAKKIYFVINNFRFVEVETCRSIARSELDPKIIHVSEWRRKNGQIDPSHSCPMNVPIDLPKEAALMSDSALILAEKLLAKLVSRFTRRKNFLFCRSLQSVLNILSQ